jgi:hypothetical protein
LVYPQTNLTFNSQRDETYSNINNLDFSVDAAF